MRTDWTRLIWANAAARMVWEPRLRSINETWRQVEFDSVRDGIRGAALVFGEDAVQRSGLPSIPVAPDRFAVGPGRRYLAHAYEQHDDDAVGQLLGFPDCCRAFFCRTWKGDSVDTTWEMIPGDQSIKTVDGPNECNILGRWLGVRFVMHLPCSFGCPQTEKIAHQLRPLWHPREFAWAQEILSWPVEWSAVHGIAEVKYPILKLSTRTTRVDGSRVVRRLGTAYPSEGAKGVVFPYQHTGGSPLSMVKESSYTDNGFKSFDAMDRAHMMVLRELFKLPPRGNVLDLGCGNGELLRRVGEVFRVPIQGIEVDPTKLGPNTLWGDIKDIATISIRCPVDTILVSQRRFEEIPTLEAWVKINARQVLVYSYDEPMFARVEK